jgi:flagellar hook-length control protein FliK
LNIDINQSDKLSSDAFGALLGEAHSALLSGAPGAVAAPLDGEQLLAGLQVLPQAGKLLPLLQQTLDKVAGAGVDLKQFVERLANKLKALAQDSVMRPEQQLAAALQQLVQEQPSLKSILPADTLALIGQAASASTRPLATGGGGADDTASASRPLELVASRAADTAAGLQRQSPQAADPDSGAFTLESLRSPLQQASAAQGQPEVDAVALLTTLKRLVVGDKTATLTDSLPRVESLLPNMATSSASVAAPSTPGAPTVTVATGLGQPGWNQALGERIQWLVGQQVHSAQVKLNPENLGPMEVRIQMQNDQANIQFTAHHAVVREALEAALPRLREMLEASGVQLVDVDVSGQQSFAGRQQAAHDQEIPHRMSGSRDESGQEIRLETPLAAFDRQGRLDLFA